MASNKEKLMKGINILALAFPFIFLGPSLYYWKGEAVRQGEWIWAAVSILMMAAGVALIIRGLAVILDGFFDQNNTPDQE